MVKRIVERWWKRVFLIVFFAGMMLSLSSIVWGVYFERPYLMYEANNVISVIKNPLHAGDIVPVRITRCNRDSVPHVYTVSRTLINVDTNEYSLMPEVTVYLPVGCTTNVSLVHRLPPDLLPGRYRLHGAAEIVGRIRIFKVEWRTDIFEVVK